MIMMLTAAQKSALADCAVAAVASEKKTGCPAELTVAQWALESAWGRIMSGENNPFGIKARPGEPCIECSTTEVINGQTKKVNQRFTSFPDLQTAFDRHGELLVKGAPYRRAFGQYEIDHDIQALALKIAPVYATDPQYGKKLLSLITSWAIRDAVQQARSRG